METDINSSNLSNLNLSSLVGKKVTSSRGQGTIENFAVNKPEEFQNPDTGEALTDAATISFDVQYLSQKDNKISLVRYTLRPFCANIDFQLLNEVRNDASSLLSSCIEAINSQRHFVLNSLFSGRLITQKTLKGHRSGTTAEIGQQNNNTFKISILWDDDRQNVKGILDPPSSGKQSNIRFSDDSLQSSYERFLQMISSKAAPVILSETALQDTERNVREESETPNRSPKSFDIASENKKLQKLQLECAEHKDDFQYFVDRIQKTEPGWQKTYLRIWALAQFKEDGNECFKSWKQYTIRAPENHIISLFSLPSFSFDERKAALYTLRKIRPADAPLPEGWFKAIVACFKDALNGNEPLEQWIVILDLADILDADLLLDPDILVILGQINGKEKQVIEAMETQLSRRRFLEIAGEVCARLQYNQTSNWMLAIARQLQRITKEESEVVISQFQDQTLFWNQLNEDQVSVLISHFKEIMEPNQYFHLTSNLYARYCAEKSPNAGAFRQWRDTLINEMLEKDSLLSDAEREDYAEQRLMQAQAKLLDQLAASLRDLERAEQEASRLIRNHIAENSANTILKSIIDARKAISFFSELHLGGKITPVVSEVDFLTGEALSYNENLHRTDGTKLREGTPVYALSMGVSADNRVVVRALVESVKTYTERTEKA